MYNLFDFRKKKAFINEEKFVNGKIKTENYFCINTKGKVLFELPKGVFATWFEEEDVAIVTKSNKYSLQALINKNGDFLCDFIYRIIYGGSEDGFFEVCHKNGKHGHIDCAGNEIIPCKYDDGGYFSEGIAAECLNGKWGAVDYNNNVVIPFIYEDMMPCYNNLIPAKQNGKWGFIDKFNNILSDFKFDELSSYAQRNCICYPSKINDKWGFVDRNGNTVEDFIYDCIKFPESNKDEDFGEYYFIQKDEKYALYSTSEAKFLTDFEFELDKDESQDCFSYSEGLFKIRKNGKYGFIDTKGNVIIEPTYTYLGEFNENAASAQIEGQNTQGVIDKTGNIIIPFEYQKIFDCSDGLFYTLKNNEAGFIDKNNNIVIPFGKFRRFNTVFSCGYAITYTKEGEEVYIDKKGNILKIDNKCNISNR